jgi:hypothetical protein
MNVANTAEPFMQVYMSQDKLHAYLYIGQIDETFEWSFASLEKWIREQGVRYGLLTDVIGKIAESPKHYVQKEILVAKGTSPTDGEDGEIRLVFDGHAEKKPVEREDGKVDLREITRLPNVKKGQRIAVRIPAGHGKAGTNVLGESIPPKSGKEARWKLGKNVVTDSEQTSLYAVIDGIVSITDKDKLNVFPVYEVNGDVDYKIGNIDFVGTVVVRGNVLTGFRVKAEGDIRVYGGVEGAELTAGGSIHVRGGIIANNKGSVSAGHSVHCSFIQEGNVQAGEDIVVSQSIMHSQLRAGRNVICSGSKGLIVGGVIQAGESVVTRTIGNTMSTATVLEVGIRPELRNELSELKRKLKENEEQLDKAEKALQLLEQMAKTGQLTQDKLALRIKLSATKQNAAKENEELREQILNLEKKLDNTEWASVKVLSTIYGGARIVIGRYTRFVKEPVQRVTFRFSGGEIAMLPNG